MPLGMDSGRRKGWMIGGALVTGAVLAFAGALWRYDDLVRDLWWPLVAARPLSEAQLDTLEACEPLGWWGWLRVLEHDQEHACGELWGRDGLAAVLGPSGRRQWLQERLRAAQGPVRSRWRAAVALEAAGEPPDVEPAWLVLEPAMPATTLAALLDEEGWEQQLGPRYEAVASARRVLVGGDLTGAGLTAWRLLAWAEGAEAALVHDAARSWVGVDPSSLPGIDRPPHELPVAWSDALHAAATCERRCVRSTLDLLEVLLNDPDGLGQPADIEASAGRGELGLVEGLVVSASEREVLRWLMQRDVRWAGQGLSPAARLRSVVQQPGPVADSLVAQAYFGRHPPLQEALWLVELAGRAALPHAVYTDGQALWSQVGEVEVAHCGVPASGEAVPVEHLMAWVLEARGEPERAARVGGWAPATPATGAVSIGRALWSERGARVPPPCGG